jgi:ABC-type uncharacterized transport system permease subunit
MVPLLWLVALLYAAASTAYLLQLTGVPAARAARWLLALGLAAHLIEIGSRGVHHLHPVTSAREAIGFLAFLIVLTFLVAQLRRPLDAVGALVAPAALALFLAARLSPAGAAEPGGLGTLGRIHISLATIGASIFGVATAIAVLYLVQERQLKRKRIGQLVRQGTALETLDTLEHRCVQVGFPIFTIAMVTGVLWSAQRQEGFRPEYSIAAVAWAAFAALLVARTTAGWRGRRAALMTIVGFASTLIVLGIYLARRVAG